MRLPDVGTDWLFVPNGQDRYENVILFGIEVRIHDPAQTGRLIGPL